MKSAIWMISLGSETSGDVLAPLLMMGAASAASKASFFRSSVRDSGILSAWARFLVARGWWWCRCDGAEPGGLCVRRHVWEIAVALDVVASDRRNRYRHRSCCTRFQESTFRFARRSWPSSLVSCCRNTSPPWLAPPATSAARTPAPACFASSVQNKPMPCSLALRDGHPISECV